MEIKVKVKKLKENATIPVRSSEYAAGYDLSACIDQSIDIKPNETIKIPTGLSFELPRDCVALIYARSGLATKQGLAPANKVGVCDSDYRGEYIVALHNHSDKIITINPGDRIAQLIFAPFFVANFEETNLLSETKRGEGGFGSTDK